MTYIELINRFWKYNRMYGFNPNEVCLFFYLLNTCNNLSWHSFRLSNQIIAGELGITETRMIEARTTLVEAGLIKFVSGRKKREPSFYSITEVNKETNPKSQSALKNESESEPGSGNETVYGSGNDRVCGSEFQSDHDSVFESGIDSEPGSGNSEKTADIIRVIDRDKDSDKDFNKEIEKRERKKEVSTAVAALPPFKKIVEDYNLICKRLPKVKEFSKARQRAAGALLRTHGPEKVHQVFQMASESDFLAGSNQRNWYANFDWIMKPGNFVKILEGYYANRCKNIYNNPPSTLEILEETYNDILNNEDITI